MFKKFGVWILGFVVCLGVGIWTLEVAAVAGEKVETILSKMESAGDYKTNKGSAIMEIINKDGDKTSMQLEMYEVMGEGDEDKKSLMRFTAPARLKGTAILSVGDNIWYYNNRTNRVRLLSSSAKKGSMMGSSFSYEDLSMSYAKDFVGQILKDDKKSYLLKIFPKDKSKTYKYIIMKVRKADYITEYAQYYKGKDLKYKVLTSLEIKKVGGRVAPMKVTMRDIESNKITNFIIDEKRIEYDIKLDDSIFSERNLRK
ncbi:outer membrane lipoprotein-sorting protein [Candidatus Margulisiibacteriota bacterium]